MATPNAARKPAAPAAAPRKPAAGAPVPAAAAANEPARAKPAKGGRRKALLAVLALAAAGGAGAWFHFGRTADAAANAAPAPRRPVFVPIDMFTVNLSSAGNDRYLQIGITLEVNETGVADEMKRQMPIVRSRILLLLASKTAEELASTAGKQKLIGELLVEARAPLTPRSPTRGVENVHFSAFVIQ